VLSLRVRFPNSFYIDNDGRGCCPNIRILIEDNKMFSDDLGFNPFDKNNDIWKQYGNYGQKTTMPSVDLSDRCNDEDYNDTLPEKAYGVPNGCGGCGLNLTNHQTKLLKTVVEYLNQASTALYFSNNRFLSSAAKDLASQLGDQFCVE
jgi:hypothetical protein